MEMSKNQAIKKKKEALKNGDLFEEIERRMSAEKLFKQKDLSREILSDLLATNREYVQQAIKDHADKTVGDYITSWRMEEAKEILSKTALHEGKTMLEISDEIGLSATSTTTFYALFKKYTEMTPTQFKKQSKAKS
jgi:AraC-like DNA-binding protein